MKKYREAYFEAADKIQNIQYYIDAANSRQGVAALQSNNQIPIFIVNTNSPFS
jgi:hypothetical protein